ncbi:hypothetical protein BDK51DRAFT_53286 [Blyttiomyces helicus]|uniref:Uncharacterized protein n=1 Tax=Blyttiomyces helicus TaxID=388810 RepID=A0A4P9WH21_9FUNG|nr:hypothetical protein BDK51DRAFT_53286 [Blyttiomyces helicus]|eukprot:RKO90688.1 hypothetical protein BDK51DRAFT_53286 [Blyttiomyces helicus]
MCFLLSRRLAESAPAPGLKEADPMVATGHGLGKDNRAMNQDYPPTMTPPRVEASAPAEPEARRRPDAKRPDGHLMDAKGESPMEERPMPLIRKLHAACVRKQPSHGYKGIHEELRASWKLERCLEKFPTRETHQLPLPSLILIVPIAKMGGLMLIHSQHALAYAAWLLALPGMGLGMVEGAVENRSVLALEGERPISFCRFRARYHTADPKNCHQMSRQHIANLRPGMRNINLSVFVLGVKRVSDFASASSGKQHESEKGPVVPGVGRGLVRVGGAEALAACDLRAG